MPDTGTAVTVALPPEPSARPGPEPTAGEHAPVRPALPEALVRHSQGVPNTNKRKGDRAEREAVAVLCELAPDLVVARPQRLLGAGRREDTGDLWVFPGVTVQVKC